MKSAGAIFCALSALSGCGFVEDRFGQAETTLSAPVAIPERVARPAFVVFETDTVLVGMDDGLQCLGASGADFGAAGWTGVLSECPYPYTYAVELAAGTVARQQTLEPAPVEVVAAQDEVPFRPLVAVSITDSNGERYRFQSAVGF